MASVSNPMTRDLSAGVSDQPQAPPYLPAAVLLLAQFILMWAAFFILMPSINWPASLGEPPSIILPLILQQAGPVFAGYLSYLLHALILIPLAILLGRTLAMGRARWRASAR